MDVPSRKKVTVEEVFADFKSRRAGIIKALTIEAEEFYQRCDPKAANLCLYGLPNGSWQVRLPNEDLPPNFPEPLLGINFARDGMQEKDWLTLLAAHSDSWLISMAFHLGSLWYFDQDKRKRLFAMINDLPTIHEIVTGEEKKPTEEEEEEEEEEESSVPSHSSNAPEPSSNKRVRTDEDEAANEDDDNDEEEEEYICGVCEDGSNRDKFWICCDACDMWFHGVCVDITPDRAERIKRYKCPLCSRKKARS